MPRRQLPVYSPLTLTALAAGGRALFGGDAIPALAERIRHAYGALDVLLTDSGTTALSLALAAASPARSGGAGPHVALPGYGCFDLATAAVGAGARLSFYDVSFPTLGPAAGSLEPLAGAKVDAVVIAHLYGLPVAGDPVRDALPDALLVDDAAQGIGGWLRGRPLGALGDVGVLSFGRGKGRTGGSGGALVATTDRGVSALETVRSRCQAGRTRPGEVVAAFAQWALARPSVYAIPAGIPWLGLGETPFHAPAPSRGIGAFAAGMLGVTWMLADAEAEVRRRRGNQWLEDAERWDGIAAPEPPAESGPGWLRFPVLASAGRAPGLTGPAARRLGIMPGYPGVLADLPGIQERTAGPLAPGAAARGLVRGLFTIPTHSHVEESDVRCLRELLDS